MYRSVVIDPGARAALFAHVASEPKKETGGILLGYPLSPEALLVTDISPPGPRAIKRSVYFMRDTRFLQRWLERRYRRSAGRHDYVGEWHVHHAIDVGPSCVDRRSLWRIARRGNYPTDTPVLLIAEDVPGERQLQGYAFTVVPKRDMRELDVATAPRADRRTARS
jgi:integrative and conjugative element protein (TIGR02256 family)